MNSKYVTLACVMIMLFLIASVSPVIAGIIFGALAFGGIFKPQYNSSQQAMNAGAFRWVRWNVGKK